MNNNNNNKNRQRGRNNNNGGRKHVNPLSRNFESNGPDVKVRGNASHVAEKYLQLARDAQSSGDPVLAENYLQHAEHYFRIVASAQPQNQGRPDQYGNTQDQDDDDDFPPMNDRFASPEPPQPFRPAQSEQSGYSGDEGGDTQSQPQQQPQQQNVAPAPQQQPQGAEPALGEDGQAFTGTPVEGEGRRHRDRNRRRRGRAPGEAGANGDPANAPQPDVGELPAFLTAGTTPTAAE